MAKPSKGKKALKSEQNAARQEKAVVPAQEIAVKAEPVKAQAKQAEKLKNGEKVPESIEPVKPASFADRAAGFLRSNLSLYTAAIIILIGAMFYLRTVPMHDLVFTNWPWLNGSTYVNVAEDDGVYHMRLVFNAIQHFPFQILFDPFTHFPYGSRIHFGPLFTIMIAGISLILGLGNPNTMLIQTVGAYFPAVLGALTVIPTYYIGKKLFGRPAGLIGAIAIAFMPGAFFWRSMLGSTDHHVAEVFFMACTIACLVYALDAARASKLSLEQLKNKDWASLKMPLIYAALSGFFFGCYLLNWVGALILGFTLFLYFTIQAIMDHYKGRSLDYIPIIAAFTFLIPTIMVLPYSLSNLSFQQVYYSITQPALFLIAFLGVCVIYTLSVILKRNKVDNLAFPATIVGVGVIGVILLYLAVPSLFGLVQYSLSMLVPSGGLTTVEEAYPTLIDRSTGGITFSPLWSMFYWAFPAALIGFIMLVFRVFRKQRPSEIMFLIWNLVMIWALIVQNRFTYYFAVNAALLTAYLAAEMFNIIDLDGLWANFKKKVEDFDGFQRFVKKNMGGCLALLFVVVVFLFIAVYPALPISDYSGSASEGILFQTAKSGPATLPYEWFDALSWMKNNTPDPQGTPIQSNFDYTKGQYYPPANYGTSNYDYPASAYGVMSWWDYGHDIEYIAQRTPNANPFQAGIIEQNGTTGAAPYFTSTDEASSVKMLDQLGSRYVVIDNQMATGKFDAIQQWVQNTDGWVAGNQTSFLYSDGSGYYMNSTKIPTIEDTAKWDNSTMNRLYYGDADGMSHYRLVYESAGAYYVDIRVVGGGAYRGFNPVPFNNLANATDVYGMYHNYVVASDSAGTQYGFGARTPTKWVKIFEKVKGATLTGSAPEGSNVTAMLTLKNDDGREFNYTATTVAHNGAYSFVVPYPTEAMKGDGYTYAVTPEGKYTITVGNTTKSVAVPESAVMNGASIQVI
jgi:oligosaccharyl transferase (archaeosortase A-associated)